MTKLWHHNLFDLMLGASCSLELSEMVLIKYTNLEQTEEGITSASSKEASSSDVATESMRIKSRPCPVFLTVVQKGVILIPWFKWEVGKC